MLTESQYMTVLSISTTINLSYAYFVAIVLHTATYHTPEHIFPDFFVTTFESTDSQVV